MVFTSFVKKKFKSNHQESLENVIYVGEVRPKKFDLHKYKMTGRVDILWRIFERIKKKLKIKSQERKNAVLVISFLNLLLVVGSESINAIWHLKINTKGRLTIESWKLLRKWRIWPWIDYKYIQSHKFVSLKVISTSGFRLEKFNHGNKHHNEDYWGEGVPLKNASFEWEFICAIVFSKNSGFLVWVEGRHT